ncbi:MAG: Lrp/AsnC ligand binding domain-containing protein [Bacteroidetes bacterium]|nr:Lrp/AsnC ligand binding domain-containing protein [Bacteroidota bacterium]
MFKSPKQFEIDSIDKQILNLLLNDSALSYQEIGRRLDMSSGTVHVRVKKMETIGIITGHKAVVDYSKVGYDISCFIGIFLKNTHDFDFVAKELEKIDELVSVDYTTGNYSMIVKVICKDTSHLRAVLIDKIQTIEGVQRTESHISLKQSLEKALVIQD